MFREEHGLLEDDNGGALTAGVLGEETVTADPEGKKAFQKFAAQLKGGKAVSTIPAVGAWAWEKVESRVTR